VQIHADALAYERDPFVLQSHLLLKARLAGQADLASGAENAMPRQSADRAQCPHYLSRRAGESGSRCDLAVGRDLTFRYFQDDGVDLREHAYRIIEALSSDRLRRRDRLFGR
jgi:hypothetical protein